MVGKWVRVGVLDMPATGADADADVWAGECCSCSRSCSGNPDVDIDVGLGLDVEGPARVSSLRIDWRTKQQRIQLILLYLLPSLS